MPVETYLVRHSLRLRRYRPVRRLIYFPDALLETRKRSRREGAVFLNRVPAVFDTAHVGFIFTDVIRHGHCSARTCIASPSDETQAFMAPAREPNSIFECRLCRPTAPALPICGTGDFGTSPIFGQLSNKPLLASVYALGVSERKAQWQIEIFADEKAVSLVPASSPIFGARRRGGARRKLAIRDSDVLI
jgi:hypothetical protein